MQFLAHMHIVELLGEFDYLEDMIGDRVSPQEQEENITPAVRRVYELSREIFFVLDAKAPDPVTYLIAQLFRDLTNKLLQLLDKHHIEDETVREIAQLPHDRANGLRNFNFAPDARRA